MFRRGVLIGLAVATGIALELGIHALSGRQEAWDSPQYWTVGIPAVFIISLILGYASQGADWLWTVLIVPSQAATMMARHGEIGNLWPLTIAVSLILGVPFIVASFLGSRFRPQRPSR